ncbi:amidase signature enzyme [Whalleya microplaca]|nr:amidase signature enzyme [Whalleya microplaca]
MASQQQKNSVSIETLRKVAETLGFRMRPQDEAGYLGIFQATAKSVDFVEGLEDYIDPRLTPNLGNDHGVRKYTQPPASDNPLNAWSHRTYIKASDSANSTGLLAGKAVAIKDNVPVAGIPTTIGTQPFHLTKDKPYPVPEIDAVLVTRVLEAGGVITGTSTCENYCVSAMSFTSATGPVENPWLKGYTAGGSSSGSAALTAINVVKKWRESRGLPVEDLGEGVDFATGGDQGGSIRIPAAYCGIYGLKPTHGLVPYTGIGSLTPILDHAGPMSSSVRDTALLLSVLAGYDGFDPLATPGTPLRANTPQYHDLLDAAIASRVAGGTWTPTTAAKGLRIGVLKEAFTIPGISKGVISAIEHATSRYAALGATVSEVSVPLHSVAPHIFTAATYAYVPDSLLSAAASSTLSFPYPRSEPPPLPDQAWYETMTEANPLVPGVLLTSAILRDRSRYPETVRNKALRHIHQLRAAYDRALEDYDVLVMPALPTVGMPHAPADMGIDDKAAFLLGNTLNTMPFNITGHPALAMPVGWGEVDDGQGDGKGKKLPVAMQIVGKRWDEETIFLAAAAWEVGGWGLDEDGE